METKRSSRVAHHPQLKWILATWVLASAAGWAQRLQIAPVEGAPGEMVRLAVALDSPANNKPVALQFEIVFPAQILEIDGEIAEPGPAAKDAGKSIRCVSSKEYAYACMLSGGIKPIENGTVVQLRFRIRARVDARVTNVRLNKALAVTKEAQPFVMQETSVAIAIRHRN